jgi:antitoxin component YwqK of YwqJK toxin-antitoxin module
MRVSDSVFAQQRELAAIFLNSEIRKENGKWRYFRNNVLRAIAEVSNGVPHGKLTLFHENGTKWISAVYENGVIRTDLTRTISSWSPLEENNGH